ncbi:MFS transporter [Succinivibrio sp.]|uniref:MFS transporter n=1 Tax=Succinivibrio sp. TaxID=2053619 RepID=UPI0038635BF2
MNNKKMLLANKLSFGILGALEAAWAPMVPFVKSAMNLNDGQFGQLLLSMGLGSLIALPLVGPLVSRFGPRKVAISSGILLGLNLFGITIVDSPYLVAFMLALFGASLVSIDVASNINAVVVESIFKKPLMSGFHGGYSLGTLVGAMIVSMLLTLGFSVSMSALFMFISMSVLCIISLQSLVSEIKSFNEENSSLNSDDSKHRKFNIPPVIIVLGILCFIMYGSEGALLSWTAVFATQNRGIDPTTAGYFYTFFAITMTVSRFTGNSIVTKFGRRLTVVTGAVMVSLGFMITAIVPYSIGMMIGFSIIGLGAGNIVPQLVSFTGTVKGIRVQSAISLINAVGYSGILLGPVIIGHVSNMSSLECSFELLGAAVAVVALISFFLMKKKN